MDNLRAINLVNEIERTFPVDQWKIQGVQIWPLIRISLDWNLQELHKPADLSGSRGLKILSSALKFTSAIVRSFYVHFAGGKHRAILQGNVDAVFLGEGRTRVLLKDSWYDRLCDPFADVLAMKGMTSFHLEANDVFRIPQYRPSMFIALDLYRVKILSKTIFRCRHVVDVRTDQYNDFLDYLHNHGINPLPYSISIIAGKVTSLLRSADYFSSLMNVLKPKIAFVVDYPAHEGLAFCLSCRRLGIPAVVIQHGVQSDVHAAYARWTRVPEEGYEVLPSLFWCWTKDEALIINRWSKHCFPVHQAIPGYNLFLQQWMDDTRPFVSYYDRLFDDLKRLHAGNVHVLVTLQYAFSEEAHLKLLLRSMQASPSEWMWWVRLHPLMMTEKERIRNMLNDNHISRFELDHASALPLYAILRNIDVHVTLQSAVILEASSFKVPSVIIDEKGTIHFKDHIRSGAAVTAFTPETVISAISHQARIHGKSSVRHRHAQLPPLDKTDALLLAADAVRLRLLQSKLLAEERPQVIK